MINVASFAAACGIRVILFGRFSAGPFLLPPIMAATKPDAPGPLNRNSTRSLTFDLWFVLGTLVASMAQL
jgi:hypothetical protein